MPKLTATIILLLLPCVGSCDVIAFIGAPRAVELSSHECSYYYLDTEVICMDRAFLLKYAILEPLVNELSQETEEFEFVGFYHYWGIPSYTSYEPALVVVEEIGQHYMLRYIKYAEITDAGWQVCEKWSLDEDVDKDCSRWRYAKEVVREIREGI